MPLTPDKKIHVRNHLIGNFVSFVISTTIEGIKEDTTEAIRDELIKTGSTIDMNTYIDKQISDFTTTSNSTAKEEIEQFNKECKDIIVQFNQEYLKLMEEMKGESNLNKELLRIKMGGLITKWILQDFT